MANSVDLRPLEARIKLLLNAQLKGILRDQGLTISGVKTELQVRLLAREEAHPHDCFPALMLTY